MAPNPRNRPPYTAGAGVNPPKFAGREDFIDLFDEGLEALEHGDYANPYAAIGPRGLGKTVLLNQLAIVAEERGWKTSTIEANPRFGIEEQLLAAINDVIKQLAPTRTAVMKLRERLTATSTLSIETTKLAPVSVQWSIVASKDPDRAGTDLTKLLVAVGDLARRKNSGCAIFVDELHEAPSDQLKSLAVGLHFLSKEREHVPFQITGAGLPLLLERTMKAGTYGERMFRIWDLQPLTVVEVADALREPAKARGRDYEDAAIELIYDETRGYPYFVQRWGIEVWRNARNPLIKLSDVEETKPRVLANLDSDFFRLRTSRLSATELNYVHAMADFPAEQRSTGAIARKLNRSSKDLSVIRDRLIRKGVIDSAGQGYVDFTVPGYDSYLQRRAASQSRGTSLS